MMFKAALALAGLFLAAPAVPEPLRVAQHPAIAMVTCEEGTGTAFHIGKGRWLSVHHVTKGTDCSIGGVPITVTYASHELDFSILAGADIGSSIKVNCKGFKSGEPYWGLGHARGFPFQQVVAVTGTRVKVSIRDGQAPLSILEGDRFIPGMSGGMVANSKGEAVGMVNAYSQLFNISFSRELKGTAICRK